MANDAFPTQTVPTIVGVRDLSYTLFDPDPDGTESQAMTYSAQILLSDGSIKVIENNVVPHLTGAEITSLQGILSRLRVKAETAWGNAP